MENLESVLNQLNAFVWGPPLLILLVGTHLFLTFRLRFIQRHIFQAIRLSVTREKEGDGEITHFGSLMTALSSTIGTGNIVGVATAIASGGPGAVFWMWMTGILGIATKYSEALLSQKFRISRNGVISGGPMYVLEHGLQARWAGKLFALFTAIAAFGIGNMVQANSISNLLHDNFSVPVQATGLMLAAITGIVIIGGIRSIARVSERLVPFMALLYVIGCIAILSLNFRTIPETIGLILETAFTGQAAIGGFLGAGMREALRFGVARGLFSNESGMGSAPIVAAAAQSSHPVRQALVSSTATFWDTVIVCALTGITIVNSGEWVNGYDGGTLTNHVFQTLPHIGPPLLTVGLLTFVISTILGWSYYGEKAVEYLFGSGSIKYYRVFWIVAAYVGSVESLSVVWTFADIANGFMTIPNLASLILLSKLLSRESDDYFLSQKK